MFVRCACRITRDTERDKMHVHHNQAALCVERDTLPIAHGWQEKARKIRLMPIFHKKTGFQNTSRESCYQARTYTPTRGRMDGWRSFCHGPRVPRCRPTAAGQPTSWLVTQGHFDVPNRAERIWPLTDEPGAAGERPPFRPMTSAGWVNVGRSDSFASLCMQGKHLAGHCITAQAERLRLPGQVIES